MDTKFYTSTNWAPWLGLGFGLSIFFLGIVSDTWTLALLVFLSFLPSLIVAFTLRGYYLVDNIQVKYCYDRWKSTRLSFSIPITEIKGIKRIGKTVVIYYSKEGVYNTRIHESEAFVAALLKYNPSINV